MGFLEGIRHLFCDMLVYRLLHSKTHNEVRMLCCKQYVILISSGVWSLHRQIVRDWSNYGLCVTWVWPAVCQQTHKKRLATGPHIPCFFCPVRTVECSPVCLYDAAAAVCCCWFAGVCVQRLWVGGYGIWQVFKELLVCFSKYIYIYIFFCNWSYPEGHLKVQKSV